MKKDKQSALDWLGERIIVAFVTTILAAVTLSLYPVVASFFVVSHGGNAQGAGIFGMYYQILFSRTGLLLMISAGGAGFLMGADRIVAIFSFFWGTHQFWSRLDERLNEWRDEHFGEGRMLILLMVILGIVLWIQFA